MKLSRLIFLLTNRAVDISLLGHDDNDRWLDSGLCFTVTLNLPLFIRRLSCNHRASSSRGLTWCFRCERPVPQKTYYANQVMIGELAEAGTRTGVAPVVEQPITNRQ